MTIEQILEFYRQHNGVPGLAAAVVWNGRRLYTGALGLANVREGRPLTPHTTFHYFSLTKLFTAVAILQLVEHNRLQLDADVREYLPALQLRRRFTEPADPPLTIRQLLSHRSGYGRDTDTFGFHFPGEPSPPSAELLKRLLAKYEMRDPPGTSTRYANLNFALLAAVIEAVTGQPYEDYLRRQVLLPLGMTTTGFTYTPAMQEDAASGYLASWSVMDIMLRWLSSSQQRQQLIVTDSWFGDKELRLFELDGRGYGGLIGSLTDLAKFLDFQLNLDDSRYESVLGSDYRRLMRQMQGNSYSLAWSVGCAGGNSASFGHIGGGPGFKAFICIMPAQGFGVVVLANKFIMADPDLQEIARVASRLPAP